MQTEIKYLYLLCFFLFPWQIIAQEQVKITFTDEQGAALKGCMVKINSDSILRKTDDNGSIELTLDKLPCRTKIILWTGEIIISEVTLKEVKKGEVFKTINSKTKLLDEIQIHGKANEKSKKNEVISIDVYHGSFLDRKKENNLFESLAQINGVRAQNNCNICNTGDIHINGLEGPYTMILMDGIPLIGNLSSVYGLSGIPTSLIEKLEIIKGPASTQYGSEAIGGVINVITKTPLQKQKISIDAYLTSQREWNLDLGFAKTFKKKWQLLTGFNGYYFNEIIDQNRDLFTDLTLQKRVALFNRLSKTFVNSSSLSLATRFYYEDRWGGDVRWDPQFRGGDSIYGESIYTTRGEYFLAYQFPEKYHLTFTHSLSYHEQNSFYGNTPFHAQQLVQFNQFNHTLKRKRWEMLQGLSYRFQYYDDNTFGTYYFDSLSAYNQPEFQHPIGYFNQTTISLNEKHQLLLGYRIDFHLIHGFIHTPRLGLKLNFKKHQSLRLNYGSGYRVVQIFTEDHAALTGGRTTVIAPDIKPERLHALYVNYEKIIVKKEHQISLEMSPFFNYFTNKIIPNYDADYTKILYQNSEGYVLNYGLNISLDYKFKNLSLNLGSTLLHQEIITKQEKTIPYLTENLSAAWTISYSFPQWSLTIDYTGNLYSPMKLPLASELDPRPGYSPWYSLHHLQISKKLKEHWKLFIGVKNLLNWLPTKSIPFLIARTEDPFDKKVVFNNDGSIQSNSNNPYALSFDPSYAYAANQGLRIQIGFHFEF